jgi:hypothetical protein
MDWLPGRERFIAEAAVSVNNIWIVVVEHKAEKLFGRVKLFRNHQQTVEWVFRSEKYFAIVLVKLHVSPNRFVYRTVVLFLLMGPERVE